MTIATMANKAVMISSVCSTDGEIVQECKSSFIDSKVMETAAENELASSFHNQSSVGGSLQPKNIFSRIPLNETFISVSSIDTGTNLLNIEDDLEKWRHSVSKLISFLKWTKISDILPTRHQFLLKIDHSETVQAALEYLTARKLLSAPVCD